MIIINSVILIGRLARDPELRFVPASGMAVAKITLAIDKDMSKEKKQEAQQKGQATADFINITVFGKSAENVANYLAKGRQVAIQGKISTGSYTTQSGEKRYTTEVIADKVEFIGNKDSGVVNHQENNNFIPSDDKDIFSPVDESDLIPF